MRYILHKEVIVSIQCIVLSIGIWLLLVFWHFWHLLNIIWKNIPSECTSIIIIFICFEHLVQMSLHITYYFSSLIYFAEKESASRWSFPDSFWWGLMVLTTVGYGERAPDTVVGQVSQMVRSTYFICKKYFRLLEVCALYWEFSLSRSPCRS